jgi:cytochrome b subunit of formate dehydrogenase
MGSKKVYITLIIVGAVAAVSGILMRRSADLSLHDMGSYIGWAGIGLLLIARITFGMKRRQPPPPKD